MVVDQDDPDGFKIGDTSFDNDCDLPLCYTNQVENWDNAIYNMISKENVLPSGEATNFINGCGGKGFAFFQFGNRKFHVYLMDFPERVYASHPKQEGCSFEEYMNLVLFHYTMVAYKLDQKMIFNKESVQKYSFPTWIILRLYGMRFNKNGVLQILILQINTRMVFF